MESLKLNLQNQSHGRSSDWKGWAPSKTARHCSRIRSLAGSSCCRQHTFGMSPLIQEAPTPSWCGARAVLGSTRGTSHSCAQRTAASPPPSQAGRCSRNLVICSIRYLDISVCPGTHCTSPMVLRKRDIVVYCSEKIHRKEKKRALAGRNLEFNQLTSLIII